MCEKKASFTLDPTFGILVYVCESYVYFSEETNIINFVIYVDHFHFSLASFGFTLSLCLFLVLHRNLKQVSLFQILDIKVIKTLFPFLSIHFMILINQSVVPLLIFFSLSNCLFFF